jgi:ATP/maltotriose-dependent transcriptional regulator MalT
MLQGDGVGETALVESVALWRELGDARGLGRALWLLGLVQAHRDRAADAAAAQESLAIARSQGDRTLESWSLWLLGEFHRRKGELALAARLYEQGLVIGTELRLAHVGQNLLSLGLVALEQGDLALASARLRESLVARAEMEERWGIPDSLEGLAWVAGAQGQAERLVCLCGAAERLREASGATLVGRRRTSRDERLAEARDRLGDVAFGRAWAAGHAMTQHEAVAYAFRADETPERTGASTLDPLTAREREVARLLARGLSDRQIADALVISPSTAGVHVHRILSKLGLHSRWQVAERYTAFL